MKSQDLPSSSAQSGMSPVDAMRISDIEKRLKKLENKMEDVNMALELIKEYGFQPKEYNEMIKILKEKRDIQRLQDKDKEEKKKKKVIYTSMDPFEKLQMALIMIAVSFMTTYIFS